MLSTEGAIKFINRSRNKVVKAKRDELIAILKEAEREIKATTQPSTAGTSTPSKKRSQRNDKADGGASFDSDEESDDPDSRAQKVTKFAKSLAGDKEKFDALTVSGTAAGAAYVAVARGMRMVLDLAPREEETARARIEMKREEDFLTEKAARARIATQREEDALRIDTLCKLCEQEAVRLKMQSDADNQKIAMQREADAMAASYKERELAAQRDADNQKLALQRDADALEAARLEQKLAYETKMSELKDRELAREKERLALETQKAAPPPPPPAAADTGLVTVRSVAYKHNMLDTVVKTKRESVLSKAGARIAADYSDDHGPNPHSVKEGAFNVCAYPQDNEEDIIRILQSEVDNATAPLGILTVEKFAVNIPKWLIKNGRKRILDEAERNVIGQILENGGKLMGTNGSRQTFAEGYHQILSDAVSSAIRDFENHIDKSKSRPINGFFSTKAPSATH